MLDRAASDRAASERAAALAKPATAAARPALPPAIAALQKVWGIAANDKSDADLSLEEAEAAAESLILKLSKAEVLPDEPVSPLAARLAAKSRTIVDDDLFETPGRPAPRILAGGR